MIGRVLAGRYTVQAIVGTGGMAIVYRAYDSIRKRIVAIKVLRPEYKQDEDFLRRFSREAEAASKVSHENIVNMLDVGTDGDERFIVMEYVDGQTLKQMIREKGRIEPDKALRMTIRILAAVDHAHRNGIVHRDIKPQNILVDQHGKVKVADFGIARLKASQATQVEGSASALGSVHYFSPEQAQGEVADEKSDLYSVGVVMYEMLTGRVPFDGENSVAIALKHVSEAPKSMRLIQEDISKALDEVVMRALCKDPAKRYQTAAEMAADLRTTISHPRGGFVKYPLDADEQERQREARKKRRQRMKKRLVTTGIIVTASMVALLLFGLVWYNISVRSRVAVPSVIGQTQDEAWQTLQAAGIGVREERAYSDDYDPGIVIGQSAKDGSHVRRGSSVTVTVSMGSQWYYMDAMVGWNEADALAKLNENEVQSIAVEYAQSDLDVGCVVAQSLEEGWQSKDTAVVLTVSGQSIAMPILTGLNIEGAGALLESEGLQVGEVTQCYAADAVADTVIGQSIAPNSMVLLGTKVDLTVNESRELTTAPKYDLTVVVPLDNIDVEITLMPPNGSEVLAFMDRLSAGTHSIPLTGDRVGRQTVRIYMEGVLMETMELDFE